MGASHTQTQRDWQGLVCNTAILTCTAHLSAEGAAVLAEEEEEDYRQDAAVRSLAAGHNSRVPPACLGALSSSLRARAQEPGPPLLLLRDIIVTTLMLASQ